ncbi:DUF928 domain-containing protein [Leptolyngbya sp. PCC 6406]|uniref:DUF928 domain-containing protein n=1 Tax=Leptolyngbya sp. PCC 6406 TaxID=1173264 RepID=UPI00138AE0CB|nr:DUF928 domain-containing protein [Leptolyngbya sp. PCC 6406]
MAPQQVAGGAVRAEFVMSSNQVPSAEVGLSFYGANPGAFASFALVAVMPESFYGTTLLARPTFMTFLPSSAARQVVFSLKDKAGNLVYRTEVPISGEAGILAITLPDDAPALEVGEHYQWFAALRINGVLTPSSPFVDAWVQRIEPSPELATLLADGDALARAEILAENGVWYDSAALFAQLRSEQPDNSAIAWHWQEFLSSVGLSELFESSIISAR